MIGARSDVYKVMEHPRQSENAAAFVCFEDFFRDHYERIVQYVARRVPAPHVDDVVSSTFVVAWKKFARVENPSLPWLFRIASYEVANQRRAWRKIGALDTLDTTGEMRQVILDDFDGTDVIDALRRLSDNDQELLRLVHWEGLSRAEVAVVLNATVNATNVRYHRALQRLQSQMPSNLSDDVVRDSMPNPIANSLIEGVLP
jgi:RNA polymerase sigma-70 factor (ECF subfamily)